MCAAPLVWATLLLASCATQPGAPAETLTISVFGTNDVHGQLLPAGNRAGLATISAYVDALRAARNEDDGALLVIDAGDMWQGTLESNLVEGADVIAAYNAIGYDAATIGNHEFDFGPAGSKSTPDNDDDDPRGALKQRLSEARFPVLAANLIDESTQKPVDWDNVRPSIVLDVKGVRVGIIGVVTEQALQTTISANTPGLRIAPLVDTISKEAFQLRKRGATIVIVTAHAGSSCSAFGDPSDLSSCDMTGEIMRVAAELPAGLVDHIVAGHVHKGISHVVNGISITSSYSSTRAFGRVDLKIDRGSGGLVSRRLFPPQRACRRILLSTGECAAPGDDPAITANAVYEGREIVPNPKVVDIVERATAQARQTKSEKLGVYLASAFRHPPSTESALANLLTDALRESTGADVALHNVIGGIRNILPAGELTFGALYEMYPFDNHIVALDLSGRELRAVIARQARNPARRAGFSGIRVFVTCPHNRMDIAMQRDDGSYIRDSDHLRVLVNDYLALGGDDILTPIMPAGGFAVDDSQPLARDILVEWFRRHSGTLEPEDFLTVKSPRWNFSADFETQCSMLEGNATIFTVRE